MPDIFKAEWLTLRSTKKYKLSRSVKNVLCSSSYFRFAVLFPAILRATLTQIVYNSDARARLTSLKPDVNNSRLLPLLKVTQRELNHYVTLRVKKKHSGAVRYGVGDPFNSLF